MSKVAFIGPAATKGLRKHGKSAISHSIGGVAHLMDADTYFGVKCNDYKEMEQYDYLVINQSTTMYRLTMELRENLPSRIKIIAFADGAHQDLTRIPFAPDGMLLIKALQVSDGFASIVEDAVDYYSLFTNKPCSFLGIPFPYEEIKKFQIPPQQKHDKLVAINGQLTNAPLRNSIGGLFLAKKVKGVRALLCEPERDKVANFLLENHIVVDIHSTINYTEFYRRYSKCYVGISLDPLGSWGRYSLDLAGMGIPVIGGPVQHTQKKLFPQLTFDPFLEMPKIISAYQRLFSDLSFYNECRNYALNMIQTEFTNEKFVSRWDNLKEMINGKNKN